MSGLEDKLNLNQNLWGLLLGFVGTGVAEYYQLEVLFWFSCVIAGVLSVSVIITTFAYTVNYWKKKMRVG